MHGGGRVLVQCKDCRGAGCDAWVAERWEGAGALLGVEVKGGEGGSAAQGMQGVGRALVGAG